MEGAIGTRLFRMFNDEDMTDVTFVVQGTEIKAHKVIVSSRGGKLKELVNNDDQRVELAEELKPQTFRTVLQYV